MTTYTLSGTFAIYHNNGSSDIGSVDLVVTGPDSMDSFVYSVLSSHPDSLDEIEFIDTIPYTMDFVGVPGLSDNAADLDGTGIGFVEWGEGLSATVLSFYTGTASYLFNLGGDDFPELLTQTDLDAWEASFTEIGGITSGPFAPGMDIDLDSLPGVSITEHDTIIGDSSVNEFHGGIGRDVIRGKGGEDELFGDKGHDKMYGGNDDDKLFGGNGNDKMYGGDGDDQLVGGGHKDLLLGEAGDDWMRGDDGDDRMYGGDGKDQMWGGIDNDILSGGDAYDKLFGDDGNDKLFGNKGSDKLSGGKGADMLTGGKGNDIMNGGHGADTFIFSAASNLGNDTINGFQDGIDTIVIAGTTTFSDLSISQNGADTLVSWLSTSITLTGIDMADVTGADFNFV